MKICWFGIYTKEYPRNKILLKGLRDCGVDVIECNTDWRLFKRYFLLVRELVKIKNQYDFLYCAYPGTVSAILGKFFSRKPIVLDAFYSMYESVVCDRAETKWYELRAIKLWILDWLSLLVADIVIVDTKAHAEYWAKWPLVNSKKICIVYLGVDNEIYKKTTDISRNSDKFIIHFHGNYIPLHGVSKIVETAKMLSDDESVVFNLIGSGGEQKSILSIINEKKLDNIKIIPRIDPVKLNEYLNTADVVLGIFGETQKAKRVVPNKVFEGMAVGKPVITMDTSAIREIFTPNEVYLVQNSPQEIVNAILRLKNDKIFREKLSEQAQKKIQDNFLPPNIAKTLIEHLNQYLKK